MYQLKDYQYDLPDDLIARFPAPERTGSRLLHFNKMTKEEKHLAFSQIEELLRAGDLVIFNNTKVMKARLRGRKPSGGRVELLVERILNDHEILAQLKVSKPPKIGDVITCHPCESRDPSINFIILNKQDRFYRLKLASAAAYTIQGVLDSIGEIPIPPYFSRESDSIDDERYQTVYAKDQGSVAAPTAGLHFDDALLQRLTSKGVNLQFLTLHIGAGTFLPVRCDNIKEHTLHHEYFEINQELVDAINETKAKGKRVIAVGTTTVRALESAAQSGELQAYRGDTNIFIYPGFKFQVVDAICTNFHLPGSSLIMLVAAFAGYRETMSLYQTGITNRYRFYSYGDAMLIE